MFTIDNGTYKSGVILSMIRNNEPEKGKLNRTPNEEVLYCKLDD